MSAEEYRIYTDLASKATFFFNTIIFSVTFQNWDIVLFLSNYKILCLVIRASQTTDYMKFHKRGEASVLLKKLCT